MSLYSTGDQKGNEITGTSAVLNAVSIVIASTYIICRIQTRNDLCEIYNIQILQAVNYTNVLEDTKTYVNIKEYICVGVHDIKLVMQWI